MWTIAGAASSRGAALIVALVVARLIGRVAYGELGIIDSSVGMFAVMANLGLSLTGTKFIAKHRTNDRDKVGRILVLCSAVAALAGLATAAAVFLSADWLATHSLGAPQLAPTLRLASATLALSPLNGSLQGALLGFQAFRRTAQLNFAVAVASVPLHLVAAAVAGLQGVVGAMALVQALSTFLYVIHVRRAAAEHGVRLALGGWWQERAVLGAFSLPALLNSWLRAPINWACLALLVNTADGYSQNGLLHAVNPWFLLMLFLPGQLNTVYYPMVEDAWARGDYGAARHVLRRATQVNVAVVAAMGVAIFAAATFILSWYGPEYRDAAWLLRINVLTGMVVAASQPLAAFLMSARSMWLITGCTAAWAAVFVAGSYFFLDYGAMGIAASRLAGYAAYSFLVAALGLRAMRRAAPQTPRYFDLAAPTSPSAAAA
jgi:O-antigen/teichoic acid export membrane protein